MFPMPRDGQVHLTTICWLLTCRHELSLYVCITSISWKLQNADGLISGTICSPEEKDVRPIQFDPAQTPHFDIVNGIWDALG